MHFYFICLRIRSEQYKSVGAGNHGMCILAGNHKTTNYEPAAKSKHELVVYANL